MVINYLENLEILFNTKQINIDFRDQTAYPDSKENILGFVTVKINDNYIFTTYPIARFKGYCSNCFSCAIIHPNEYSLIQESKCNFS